MVPTGLSQKLFLGIMLINLTIDKFEADYQGLTKNFCHGKIYCSSVTARLINLKIGISWEKIHILPLNQKIIIGGVGVTCFDANHCPGAIIILFEPPNGKVCSLVLGISCAKKRKTKNSGCIFHIGKCIRN